MGVDLGIRMLATSYDGETTVFQHGGEVKSKRGKYKRLRQQLQNAAPEALADDSRP